MKMLIIMIMVLASCGKDPVTKNTSNQSALYSDWPAEAYWAEGSRDSFFTSSYLFIKTKGEDFVIDMYTPINANTNYYHKRLVGKLHPDGHYIIDQQSSNNIGCDLGLRFERIQPDIYKGLSYNGSYRAFLLSQNRNIKESELKLEPCN